MSGFLKRALVVATLIGGGFYAQAARADGCYTCGGGSTEGCKNFCRYSGEDTFAARKDCEKRGCKVVSTAACPNSPNAKVCIAPIKSDDRTTVASIPWCLPNPRS